MADLGVRLVIEAENTASAPIDATQAAYNRLVEAMKAGNAEAAKFSDQLWAGKRNADDLMRAYGQLAEQTSAVGRGSKDATTALQPLGEAFSVNARAARLMGTTIAGELSPALGGAASRMVGLLAMVQGLSAGMQLLVGAAAVAAFTIGEYLTAVEKAAEAQAKLNIAVRSFDSAGLLGQIKQINQELEASAVRQTTWGGALIDRLKRGLEYFAPATKEELLAQALGDVSVTETAFGIPLAGQQRTLASAQAARAAAAAQARFPAYQLDAGLVATQRSALRAEQQAAEVALDLKYAQQIAVAQGALPPGMALPPEVLQRFQLEQAADRTRLRSGYAVAGSGLSLTAEQQRDYLASLQTPHLDVFGPSTFMADEEHAFAIGRAAALDIRSENLRMDFGPQAEYEKTYAAEFEYGHRGRDVFTPFRSAQLLRQRDLMQAQVQGLQIAGQMPGLSDLDRLQLAMQEQGLRTGELLQRRRDLQPGDTEGARVVDQQLANVNAQRTLLGAQVQTLTDPAAGLALGFKQVADQGGEWGRQMTELATATATSMQQAFATGFFDVITGNFKDLPSVAKQFSEELVKEVVASLSRIVTAPFFNQLSQAFGGVPGLASPFGSAGAAGVSAAGLMPFVVSGSAGIARAQAAGYSIVATPSGQTVAVPPGSPSFGVPSVSSGTLTDLTGGTALGDFLNSPLFKQPAGVSQDVFYQQALAAGMSPMDANAFALQAHGAQPTGTLPGLTVGTGLGIGLSAAAYGFTLYSALTGPPTAQNIAVSGISGAITGASLGASIALAAGAGAGVGGLVGAIAGGLLAAGAAALGKGGESDADKKKRQGAEIARTSGDVRKLIGQVQQTKSIGALFDLLNGAAPGRGGQGVVTGFFQWIVVAGTRKEMASPARPNTVSLDEFTKFAGDSYGAAFQAGVDANLLAQLNATFSSAVRAQTAALAAIGAIALFGFREDLGALPRGAGDIERLTLLSGASRISEAAGQDILASRDSLRALGLDDDAIEALLLRLKAVDRNRDLGVLPDDELLAFAT
jgi:hypothetical protein